MLLKNVRPYLIGAICSLIGAIAVPRLWGWTVSGLSLSTGSWLLLLVLVACISFLLGALLWLSIPNRIRQALDSFTLQMGIRIETIEGRLGDRLGELRLLLEQHLANKDQEAIASHESLMAEFVPVFLTRAIADSHLAAGQCKVCGGKHPKASELQPGDPALYSYEAHGKLEDGKPCPVPFLYKLAKDRHNIQSRLSK